MAATSSGVVKALAAPWSTRAVRKSSIVGARAHSTVAATNPASATRITRPAPTAPPVCR